MKLSMSKGLTNAIAILMLIIVVLVIAIPMITFFANSQQAGSAKLALVNNYIFLKSLQVKQVEYGHPAIYYANSSIEFYYTNGTFVPPTNLTIVKILYFSGGVWLNLSYNYPITVSSFTNLTLPSYVQSKPIIIVTSLGNVFFLTPKSSIGPYSTSARGGLVIGAEIAEPSGPIGVSTNVTTNIDGSYKNYTTPTAFPNQTGTFVVKAPEYVFYERPNGSIVTGVFHNWIVGGQVTLNSTNSRVAQVTLGGGSMSLIANYTPVTKIITLQISSYPSTKFNITVDGISYTINGSENITALAGYINISVNTLQFNNTNLESKGIIYHYTYGSSLINSVNYPVDNFIAFINPSNNYSDLSVQYINNYNYIRIEANYSAIDYPENVTGIYLYNVIGIFYYIIIVSNVTPLTLNKPSQYGLYFELNNSLYNYSSPFWIKNGTYSLSGIGKFVPIGYLPLKYSHEELISISSLPSTYINVTYTNHPPSIFQAGLSWETYEFLNTSSRTTLPAVITINSPLNITVVYTWYVGWNQL
ncbi:hypothetical protein L3N51_01810 [Metallosphaera sp. J1]|uniref:hypothetical protein n=1 Tax=Metallosphaera javensis (ex Hofmann et al. 2022) TaxID=99938 RepID=UPI001EE04E47|nr:hypothetical protein [Metallosphaera javensis (ex Hofmann et al. 2022)]MCG3109517.1 hypothetical protein [Metallosphaera javensis (ex Hofmann et al. 2022)]